MKNTSLALLTLLTLAGTVLAAPRESRNAPAVIDVLPDPLTSDFTLAFTGSDAGGPYMATRIRFDGSMTAVAEFTYAYDTIVSVTPPGGAPIAFRMSQDYATYTVVAISLNRSLGGTYSPAGDWAFSCTDDYDDSQFDPASNGVESTLDGLVITLDDQPVVAPGATNLGTLVDGTEISQEVTVDAAGVVWFRFTCADVSAAASRTLDINTLDSVNGGDSQLGLYTPTGAFVDANDDAGGTLFSQLSYGLLGTGGDLAAGEYFLAVTSFPATFLDTEWDVTSEGAGGTFDLEILQSLPLVPLATGNAAVSGSIVLFTVDVIPAVNPTSTFITVHGNLTSIAGSANQLFYDDGTHGDLVGGDNTFSYEATIPASHADGDALSVSYIVADAQNRTATGDIAFNADIGDLPATAYIPVGTGSLDSIAGTFGINDADMYKISICDPGSFSATTFGGSDADTQLFLFDSNGMGVAANDDSQATAQSTLTNQFVTSPGVYYLAITGYNLDAVDSSDALIWNSTPFGTERAPDGPGASNPVAGWGGTSFYENYPYTITLTGACYPSNGPVCGPADVGSTGGTPGADGHLDNNDFVVYIEYFFTHNPIADMGTTGGTPGADGAWDNNDFVVYIDYFFTAPASCR